MISKKKNPEEEVFTQMFQEMFTLLSKIHRISEDLLVKAKSEMTHSLRSLSYGQPQDKLYSDKSRFYWMLGIFKQWITLKINVHLYTEQPLRASSTTRLSAKLFMGIG